MQKAPIHQSHIHRKIKILRTIFEKGHPRNIPVKLFQNLTSGFGEKSFLRISSCPYSAKSPHSPEPYFRQIKILRSKFCEQVLKRVTQGIFLWNYFKIWPAVSKKKIIWALLHVPILREAPINQSHVYGWIKISRTVFEKGHPRNIPVKLFQNLTSSFGEEDFLRISSCPYSARSPHSPEPCLWMDQNFANNFWKGSPQEHSCEVISKSDQ